MTMKRVLIVVVALALLAGVFFVGNRSSGGGSDESLIIVPQPVSRRTLSDILTVSGELRRDELQEINSPVDGKVSEVDVVDGDEVVNGDTLFSLDGRAAVAVHGDFAFYRSLDVGSDGPDVEQLETVLADAGYSPGRVDNLYTEQTRTALARWQRDHEYGGATPEPSEIVTVSLQSNAAGYDVGKANTVAVTIGPSAPASSSSGRSALPSARAAATADKPLITVAASPARIDEGGTATFTFTADPAPTNATSLDIALAGAATAGDSDDETADYEEVADTFLFPAGRTTASFTVTAFVDEVKESDEDISVELSDIFGNDPQYIVGPISEASVIINANGTDVVPVLTLESSTDVMAEDGSATITVTSDVESNEEIELFVEVIGNAVVAEDYEELDEEITLGADSTEMTFDITPREDNRVEGDEFIVVRLLPPPADAQQYTVGSPDSASVVIESADIPEMTLVGGGSVSEGGRSSFTVVSDEPVAEDTSINYQVGGTADPGVDFETLSGTVIMRAGTSSVVVSIVTLDDDVVFEPSDMIVANWPARVGTVEVDDGEFVLQGATVLTLTEPTFTVTMKVSPSERAELEVGLVASVDLQAGDQTVEGVISSLEESATVAEDGTESYEGIIEVTGELDAVDGANVTIDVTLDERPDVVAVPVAAVVESGGEKQVRVVEDDGTLKRVTITVGLVDDDFIEVTEGLEGGELVVVSVEAEAEAPPE